MDVLIIEDDENLSKALAYILEENNYKTEVASDGEEGFNLASNKSYDVIVLDRMMPKMDGITVCEKLRKQNNNTPIIMLTARDSVEDKIKGLDSGADDYMTKPFAPQELLAHLNAITRRKGGVIQTSCKFSDLELNTDEKNLICSGQSINLDKQEFTLIKTLIENSNQAISKDELVNKVWGSNSYVGKNNIDSYITFMQKKLKYLNSKCKIVQNQDNYKLSEK